MNPTAWTTHGAYEVATTESTLAARSKTFDEELRDFARSMRARWDGLEKAWVFPLKRQAEVLHGLDQLTADKAAKAAQHALESALIAQRLSEEPFFFHGPKLDIHLDQARRQFVVKFPYNENLSSILRSAGGRWCPETRAYLAPLSALPLLEKISDGPRLEAQHYHERNAPAILRESQDPFALWLDQAQSTKAQRAASAADDAVIALSAQPDSTQERSPSKSGSAAKSTAKKSKEEDTLDIKVQADTAAATYKVVFPFAIDSILGMQIIRPALFDSGALDPARPEDVDHVYPRVNLNSAVFEMCRRDALQDALLRVIDSIAQLGPCSRIDIPNESLEGRRWRHQNVEPKAGEVVLREGKAWLVAKSNKGSKKTTLRVHPLRAAQAQTHINTLGSTGKKRVCDMSGIDFEALGPYVEALFLGEISATKEPRALGPRKTRL